jgi:hypothetical protein
MADTWMKSKRSEVMSRAKSRGNPRTELAFLSLMRSARIKRWRRHLPLFGSLDFVFPREKLRLSSMVASGTVSHCAIGVLSPMNYFRTKHSKQADGAIRVFRGPCASMAGA